jgi:two-component system, OmpR family, sensor histidine kinase MtrB
VTKSSPKATRLVPILRAAGVVLGAAGIIASGVLIVSTSRLEAIANRLSAAVETVYAAAHAERALLVHNRACELVDATDLPEHRVERDRARHGLERSLGALSQLAESETERELLQGVTDSTAAYLKAREEGAVGGRLAGAVGLEIAGLVRDAERALATLAQLNHEESQAFQREAQAENARATLAGWWLAAVVLMVVAVVLFVLHRQIQRPLQRMKQQILSIEAGKLIPLAPDGPAELRELADVFNQLIEQLQLHRTSQLRFLAGIAHDLRTPLNAMKLSAELLYGSNLSEEERETLRAIDRQILQLDRQVGDLLDTTRIESGQLELRITEQDLTQLVENAVAVFRKMSDRHRIHVIRPDAPVMYPCDPTRIGQVLNNLLSNAIKYSPSGGDVTAEVSATDASVEISVRDEGIGISAEDLPHVFEPFRRTASTRDAIPGVGLGLSVARRIAEAHGGSIEVKSVAAAGSSFTLTLPRGAKPRASGQRSSRPAPAIA